MLDLHLCLVNFVVFLKMFLNILLLLPELFIAKKTYNFFLFKQLQPKSLYLSAGLNKQGLLRD